MIGRRQASLAALGLVLIASSGCRREAELPYDIRNGYIIPAEHAQLELPLTKSQANELGERPGYEVEMHDRPWRGRHLPYTTAKVRRDGELIMVIQYDSGRLREVELIEADRVRVFEAVMLDYGGDQLLAEVERIPIGPDGARGEPVARDFREQFDPLPLYRRYYERRDTVEWRRKVVFSYIEDFDPDADPHEVAAMLAQE